MHIFKFAVALSFLITSFGSLACSADGSEGFLPENRFRIPLYTSRSGGITEEQFNKVIDKVEFLYAPLVREQGGILSVERNWKDATVNAYASQSRTNWKVAMFGGLARHPAITEDGFALVICHEIGHHIGGAPQKLEENEIYSWASNEGQADYFAALKCLRRVFENDNNERALKGMIIPEELENKCKAVWENSKDRVLCMRTGMAGDSVARLFADLSSAPIAKFETPDQRIVRRTDDNHPAHQCRLDTYLQGSLCKVDFHVPVDNNDEVPGTCHGALGSRIGLRPNCWFKPSVE